MRFVVFDVETPNAANDRMSAIGISIVENGVITKEFDSIVNPEVPFHPFNIQLTGITPAMAAEAPTFPELWQIIEPKMSSGILIAHNAPFDMGVLAKCLRAYGIQWRAFAEYACTCKMGRACYPNLWNHKLNTLCDHCGVSLEHHRASSDSHACASLLIDYMQHGLDPASYIKTFDLNAMRTLQRR